MDSINEVGINQLHPSYQPPYKSNIKGYNDPFPFFGLDYEIQNKNDARGGLRIDITLKT